MFIKEQKTHERGIRRLHTRPWFGNPRGKNSRKSDWMWLRRTGLSDGNEEPEKFNSGSREVAGNCDGGKNTYGVVEERRRMRILFFFFCREKKRSRFNTV